MGSLWGGRFTAGLDSTAKQLSYTRDSQLLPYDIAVNRAHVAGLKRAGYIQDTDADAIIQALDNLSPVLPDAIDDEDVHSYVERVIIEQVGVAGKAMHTGKSRNDQVMTDIRLYLMTEINAIQAQIKSLISSLHTLASEHKSVIMPGFTHFQPAQPVRFSHHILAYASMLMRDYHRLDDCIRRTDSCPLGSGALAGSNYDLDRVYIAKKLGFSKVSDNSMDAVADRDFMLEFVSSSLTLMLHIGRFCEELVLWSSPAFNFIQLGDAFTTGSSLMPQKKNPDMAELIRAKSGRILGHVSTLSMIIKGLPLTYNRDLQEDKYPIYDTIETVQVALSCLTAMIPTLVVNKQAITTALTSGYLTATELADYLVSKAVPFREAHHITGQIVLHAIQQESTLENLSLDDFQSYSTAIQADVYAWLSPDLSVDRKSDWGGTSLKSVERQLDRIQEFIA